MKKLITVCLMMLLPKFVEAQNLIPLFDATGRPQYDRDTPSSGDATNYDSTFRPCLKENITSIIGFRGYDEGQDWQGLGEAYYYLKFNSSGTCVATDKTGLTNPIIFMDGFDPLDSRSPAKIYGRYLSYKEPSGVNIVRLGNFLRNGINPNNPTQTFNKFDIVILNFPQYRRGGLTSQTYPCPIPANVPNRDLYCQQAGYPRTVTFGSPEQTVDGGADYMERNAMVLVELIQRTKGGLAF